MDGLTCPACHFLSTDKHRMIDHIINRFHVTEHPVVWNASTETVRWSLNISHLSTDVIIQVLSSVLVEIYDHSGYMTAHTCLQNLFSTGALSLNTADLGTELEKMLNTYA